MAPYVYYLVILALIGHWHFSRVESHMHDPSSTSHQTRTGFEFINELNLHPKLDANILNPNAPDSQSITNSRIVEKQLRLPVHGESGASIHDLIHLAGYVRINHTIGARMFYYFFKSRNKKDDPVVIWLTGGPGCSSAIGLFEENGPFHLTPNLSLVWNNYGWDKVSNIIYIDQPIGTGFSYTTSEKDIRHDEKGVSDDLYDFLQGFFTLHPDYVKNYLYITGESYGGHYIPAFAARINQGNKKKEGIHINLKGFAIGNGITEPGIQYTACPDYALLNNLINKTDYLRINKMGPMCENAANKCGTNGTNSCLDAIHVCVQIHQEIVDISDFCAYDIRKKNCLIMSGNDEFLNMALVKKYTPRTDEFLNMASVKEALGVPQDINWEYCSDSVHDAMIYDIMRNLAVGLPELLEDGIKMLIYAGEYDFKCNRLGNYRWVKAMKWSGQRGFKASKVIRFKVDGKEAGLLKNHGPLSFLKVYDAGHMVPSDQPKASLHMLKMWMDGKLNQTKMKRI